MISKAKIILLTIFIVVIVAHTIRDIHQPVFSGGDMALLGVMIAKDMHPQLFSRDYLFADDYYYRFYTPSLSGWLRCF